MARKELVNHPKYALVMQWVKDAQRVQGKAGWPGLPIGQIPMMCLPQLRAMLDDGMAVAIERPARVNPTQTRTFIALTPAGEQEWHTLTWDA